MIKQLFSNKTNPIKQIFRDGASMPIMLSSLSLFLGTFICVISIFFLSFIDTSILFSDAKDKFYIVSKDISFLHTINKNFLNINDHDISNLTNVRGVKRVGKIYSSEFPCRIFLAGNINYYSEVFLESLDNQYIAIDKTGFNWDPSQNKIPLIISKEFLHLYNYSFVRSNGLPVLTEKTAELLPLSIGVKGNSNQKQYKATIHGFSDRYLSILVPMEFLLWANNYYAGKTSSEIRPTKLVVEISEKHPEPFLDYIEKNNYVIQNNKVGISENIKLIKVIIIFFVFLGISIIIVSLFFIYFSNQLIFEKERENIIKLQLIGHSFAFIRSLLLIRSIVAAVITLLVAFIFGFAGISLILNQVDGFFEFENIKLRLLIIYSLITILFLLIIYITNRRLKIRGVF